MYVIALICNLLIFLFGLIGCIREFRREGIKITRYYTFDSNVLGIIAGGLMSVELFRFLLTGCEISAVAQTMKFMSVVCLSLTFFVALFVLSPQMGGFYSGMIHNNLIFVHTLCPLLAIVSFLFMDPISQLNLSMVFIAWIPTVIYAIITVILNVLKVLEGPYPFLHVYKQPWYVSVGWAVGIVGANFLYAYLMMVLQNVID